MLIRPLLFFAAFAAAAHAENWPQWRGPRSDGRSAEAAFPTTWSKTENVVWRTPLPGSGHASPIVYGGKIFTVAASAETVRVVAPRRLPRCSICKYFCFSPHSAPA